MDETVSFKSCDIAAMREYRVADEKKPEEINVSFEYPGNHGPISCFYYATLSEEAKQRLPAFTSLKILADGDKWNAILYTEPERITLDFTQELEPLCAAHSVTLAK